MSVGEEEKDKIEVRWVLHESGRYFNEYHLCKNDKMNHFVRIVEVKTENGVFYKFKDSARKIFISNMTKRNLEEYLRRRNMPLLHERRYYRPRKKAEIRGFEKVYHK
jgi:hypothetical protein